MAGEGVPLGKGGEIFKSLYQGFTKEATIRFSYGEANPNYEHPISFDFLEVCGDSRDLFKIMVIPAIPLVAFHQCRQRPQTYEFYYPFVLSCQTRARPDVDQAVFRR